MLETSLFVGILVFTSVWNFVLNLFTIMIWQINELVPTYSYKKYIMRSLVARLIPLHFENVDK